MAQAVDAALSIRGAVMLQTGDREQVVELALDGAGRGGGFADTANLRSKCNVRSVADSRWIKRDGPDGWGSRDLEIRLDLPRHSHDLVAVRR